MRTSRATFRGQPLLLLFGVVGGWMSLRAAVWAPPFAVPPLIDELLARPLLASAAARPAEREPAGRPFPLREPRYTAMALPSRATGPSTRVSEPAAIGDGLPFAGSAAQPAESLFARVPAALSALQAAPFIAPPVRPAAEEAARWSAEAWVMLREGGGPLSSTLPSYGRSQAGAVLRFRLGPSDGHRMQAHVRVSTALAGPRDRELAAGISARPLAALPLRAAAEVRIGEGGAGTTVRPAAYLVTELPPQPLPFRLRAETYLQAGYVGGEYATAFIDGQARVDRAIIDGDTQLRAGAGAWGGAQEGAARLDVGPTASIGFRLGRGHGRIAADYRVRVAGEAQPASGGALTLSAGF